MWSDALNSKTECKLLAVGLVVTSTAATLLWLAYVLDRNVVEVVWTGAIIALMLAAAQFALRYGEVYTDGR